MSLVVPIALQPAFAATGSITGTVTGPGGPVSGVTVTAEISPSTPGDGHFVVTTTAVDGTYTVAGLATGNFTVTFEKTGLVPERYNDQSFFVNGNLVAVTDGAATTGINAALAQAFSIAGTVTGPDNLPLAGALVVANDDSDPPAAGAGHYSETTTASDGTYRLDFLVADTYRVEFSKAGLQTELYNNDFAGDTNTDNPVTITATNVTGINARLEAATPSAPLSVTGTPGNTQVSVSWTAPTSSGNAGAITGYTVTASPGGATCTTAGLTCNVTGLSNGTAYTFTVKAANPSGQGTASAASASVTPRTVPSAPTGVTAVAGNTIATVSWTAPADGGSPITSYAVTAAPGGATCTTAALTCNVPGLTNGTSYTFTVKATNAAGQGPASSASNAVGPGIVPTAPAGVVAVPHSGTVSVSWQASGTNGGSAITGYSVSSTPGNKTCTTTGALTCTVTGLTNGTTYTFSVFALNSIGQSLPGVSSPTTPGASLTSLTPGRVLETRSGLSTVDGQFNAVGLRAGGSVTELPVAGRAGVPADAAAVVLNVTVTEPALAGFVTVYPCGVDRPNASSVNFVAGQTIANAVTAKVGTGGKVCLFTNVATHLVVDVTGSYPVGSAFTSLTPGRVLETRSGLSTVDGQFNAVGLRAGGSVTELPVAGRAGVPADAAAVVLNVTVTEPALAGFVTVYPCGVDRPNASSVNFVAGQTIANAVTAKVGTGGKVCLFTNVATHLVVDVTGSYPAGSAFTSLTPGRVLETRSGLSTVDGQFNAVGLRAGGSVTELPVAGRAGVPADAAAVVLNVTVTEPALAGFVTVYPCGVDRPNASSVNFVAGQTVANAVTAKVGTGGKVCLFTNVDTHLVVDVTGSFGS